MNIPVVKNEELEEFAFVVVNLPFHASFLPVCAQLFFLGILALLCLNSKVDFLILSQST